MTHVYQRLLSLYPAAHRREFGDEMRAVFDEANHDSQDKTAAVRASFLAREFAGLIAGALREHVRVLANFDITDILSTRRFNMRNGFRFPKSTAILMTIILLGVIMAIQKGESIANSLPHVNPQIPPIVEGHSALLPPIALYVAFFYALGLIGWIILHALHRSGVHRLDDISEQTK